MKNSIKKAMRLFGALLLALLFLTACGQDKTKDSANKQFDSDLEYIKDKGKLAVGVTEFKPLDYRRNGKWVGFDAELAEWFADELDILVEFKEIEWNQKADLLKDGTIDCIWNGMSLSKEGQETMSCSIPYLNNGQVIVVASNNTNQLQSEEDCIHLLFAVEAGSSGEEELKNRHYRFNSVKSQTDALENVASGKTDAAVIDALMAKAVIGKGKEYENLKCIDTLNKEECVVVFRNDSDLVKIFNDFFVKCYNNGSIEELADKYAVQTSLIQLN